MKSQCYLLISCILLYQVAIKEAIGQQSDSLSANENIHMLSNQQESQINNDLTSINRGLPLKGKLYNIFLLRKNNNKLC